MSVDVSDILVYIVLKIKYYLTFKSTKA